MVQDMSVMSVYPDICSMYRLCDDDWKTVDPKKADVDATIWARNIRRNILDTLDIFVKVEAYCRFEFLSLFSLLATRVGRR